MREGEQVRRTAGDDTCREDDEWRGGRTGDKRESSRRHVERAQLGTGPVRTEGEHETKGYTWRNEC